MFDLLLEGAPLYFSAASVLLTVLGIIGGLVIGVLPGLGPLMGIVLLLPVAFHLEPIPAMAMLIAVYVGGSAGGSISAILLRIPGTPAAIATEAAALTVAPAVAGTDAAIAGTARTTAAGMPSTLGNPVLPGRNPRGCAPVGWNTWWGGSPISSRQRPSNIE